MSGLLTSHRINRAVLILSLIVFVYFYLMFFISAYRSEYVLIGVFVELLTIPMLIVLAALIVLSVVQMIKENFSSAYPVYSFILLLAVIIGFVTM